MSMVETEPDSGWWHGDDMPRVLDLMTPDVLCVSADFDLDEVREIMLREGIGCVPVVDERGLPLGVLSRTDLLRVPQGMKGTVGQLATAHPFIVLESSFVPRAAALMAYQLVHHLVVISQEGFVVGMLSSLDVVRWVAEREGFVVPPRSEK